MHTTATAKLMTRIQLRYARSRKHMEEILTLLPEKGVVVDQGYVNYLGPGTKKNMHRVRAYAEEQLKELDRELDKGTPDIEKAESLLQDFRETASAVYMGQVIDAETAFVPEISDREQQGWRITMTAIGQRIKDADLPRLHRELGDMARVEDRARDHALQDTDRIDPELKKDLLKAKKVVTEVYKDPLVPKKVNDWPDHVWQGYGRGDNRRDKKSAKINVGTGGRTILAMIERFLQGAGTQRHRSSLLRGLDSLGDLAMTLAEIIPDPKESYRMVTWGHEVEDVWNALRDRRFP